MNDDLELEGADVAPRSRRGRTAAVLGVAAGLVAGGAIGLTATLPHLTSAASSVEQETTGTDDTSGDTTPADSTPADSTAPADDTVVPLPSNGDADPVDGRERGTRLREVLQPLVDDGTIDQAQLDAVVERLVASRPDGGFGRGEHGHRGGMLLGDGTLTDLLGIEADELFAALRDGKTLAEVATEHGVEPQAVIDALVGVAKTGLDQAVANGRLTQDEADARLADLTTRITDMVNNGVPAGGMGMPGRGHGHHGDDDASDPSDGAADATTVTVTDDTADA